MKGMWNYSSFTYVPDNEYSRECLIEILSKARKIAKGVIQTNRVIENKKVKAVIIAMDKYPPEVVAHLPLICKEKNIPCISVPKKTLQEIYGIDDSVAILQLGPRTRNAYEKILAEYLAQMRRTFLI